MLHLRTFGGPGVYVDGVSATGAAQQRKTLALLALVAAAGPRGISRDKLIAALWPETDSRHGRALLKQACYALRRDLRARDLFLGSIQLHLNPAVISSDVESFRCALRNDDPAGAVSLCTAPFLDGFHLNNGGDFEVWAEAERAQLAHQCRGALEALALEATERGEHTVAAGWWRRVLELDSLSEHGALCLMTALDRAGERAEALRFGQAFGQLMRKELGTDLSPELSAWIERHRHLKSIAVLPFVVLSEEGNARALSLGFADALITLLGNLNDVVVRPTSAMLSYTPDAQPAQVCRDQDVRHALQGTAQRLNSQWRVSFQLFDSERDRITLSETYDFPLSNVFDVQDEIGRRVVESLQIRFPSAVPRSRDRYSGDPEAYREFMSGLRVSASDQQDELRRAAEHLSQAVSLDPSFALAHATLALVSMDIHFHFDPQLTWLRRAEDHARRALALDPALPEGNLARAWILWSPAKNFQHADAIAALEQVLAVRPNLERAHNRMATICQHIGRLDDADIAHGQAQRVSPRSRTGNLEWSYIFSGDFERAETAAEEWFRDRPGNLYALATRIYPPLLSGDLDLADERLREALVLLPDEPWFLSFQGMLYAMRGQADLALTSTRSALEAPGTFGHTHHTYYNVACVHAVLGQSDTAMAWLGRAVNSGFACWPFFRLDPFLESLRENPAFEQLMSDLELTYGSLEIQRL